MSVVKKRGNSEVKSEAIKVGDIIHLTEDQEVPCDAIVLSTSHAQVGIIVLIYLCTKVGVELLELLCATQ